MTWHRVDGFMKALSRDDAIDATMAPTRSEFTQTRKRNDPRRRAMATSRISEVKAPQHFKTRRSYGVDGLEALLEVRLDLRGPTLTKLPQLSLTSA